MNPLDKPRNNEQERRERPARERDRAQRVAEQDGTPARLMDQHSPKRNPPTAPVSERNEIANLPWPMKEERLGGRAHTVLAATSNDTLADTLRIFPIIEQEFSQLRAWSQTKEISIEHARKMCPVGTAYAKDEDFRTLLLPYEDEAGRGKKFGPKKFVAQMLGRHIGVRASTLERYQRHEGSRQKKRSPRTK